MIRRSYHLSILLVTASLILSACTQTNSPTTPYSVKNTQIDFLRQAEKVLIKNAAMVISMDPALGEGNLGIIKNADVLLVGDRIAEIGRELQAPEAFTINARGKIVMPGFVDVHNHLWQSMIRGCGSDRDLMDWLDQCVFPLADAGITEKEAYAAVKLSIADLINTGVTTVVDDSHAYNPAFVDGNLKALVESGIRFAFAHCGSEARFEEMKRIKDDIIDINPRASFQICSHPSMDVLDWLKSASQLAQAMQVPLNLHLAENYRQAEEQPMQAMELAGSFNNELLLNHVIHLTDEEIAKIARHDARVSHNPVSNMRLASGIFPFEKMKKAGIKMGLGLDGGVNDTSDFFANMKAAVGLQRVKTLDPSTSPTVEEVLRMATLGGAEVLNMQDRTGSLTPGKNADLLILNPQKIHFAPLWDWLSQLVFNARPGDVEYVFVDGRALKAEGKVLYINEKDLLMEVQQTSDRIQRFLRPGAIHP